MGEHARNVANSIIAANQTSKAPLALNVFNLKINPTKPETNSELNHLLVRQPNTRLNLLCLNADTTIDLTKILSSQLFNEERYTIGYWMWELDKFPEEWYPALDLVNEIWAPSLFVQKTLQKVTDKPVLHMPLRVEPGDHQPFEPLKYGCANTPSMMFFYDFNSYYHRKNPAAILDAYDQAFGDLPEDERPQLVIKTQGAALHPEMKAALENRAGKQRSVQLIHDFLTRAEMNGLIKWCYAFVSLHRAEGFGYGLAEAMYYGKPVIGTAYSGNMDFMNKDNSFLVDYSLVPVKPGEYLLSDGASWAEPDTRHAARHMKTLYANPEKAEIIGRNARAHIKKHHNGAVIGRCYHDRLLEIL